MTPITSEREARELREELICVYRGIGNDEAAANHEAALTHQEAQQGGEPKCPKCTFATLLYECPACSATNYPPQQEAQQGNSAFLRERAQLDAEWVALRDLRRATQQEAQGAARAALAASPAPSAGLEQRARELLAAEYERDGLANSAEYLRADPSHYSLRDSRAIRAIVAALAAAPAADRVDARRYRKLREEDIDLSALLSLVVGIRQDPEGGHKTYIRARRHTHYLDAAIDAAIEQEQTP